MITKEEVLRVTEAMFTLDKNPPRFSLEEILDYLYRKGYDVLIHRCERNTQIIRSIPCSGSVERVGDPVPMMREFVLAVKPNEKLPDNMNGENYLKYFFHSVFETELKKSWLK